MDVRVGFLERLRVVDSAGSRRLESQAIRRLLQGSG